MTVTIVADDLTGACDTGALFCGGGAVGVFVGPPWPGLGPHAAALDTGSRALAAPDAAARVGAIARTIAGRLRSGRVMKKIDSTMRGAVGAEIDALLDVTGIDTALVCPAFPEQGRVVVDGTLLVDGRPAHLSPLAQDPDYPGATSDVAGMLSGHTSRPVSSLLLEDVRGAVAGLGRVLDGRRGHVMVADAETRADLDVLAEAAVPRPAILIAGSAGLARSCAGVLGLDGEPVPLPRGRGWLFVVGSRHPAARAQLAALAAAGVAGAWVGDAEGPRADAVVSALAAGRPAFIATGEEASMAREDAAAALAGLVASVLERSAPDALVVTGGETARALMRSVGAARLDLLGSPGSGLALARLPVPGAGGSSRALDIVTKAGGFGSPDLFLQMLRGTVP
jgi:uncharacterized protein YgbK (DUF1537 family)